MGRIDERQQEILLNGAMIALGSVLLTGLPAITDRHSQWRRPYNNVW